LQQEYNALRAENDRLIQIFEEDPTNTDLKKEILELQQEIRSHPKHTQPVSKEKEYKESSETSSSSSKQKYKPPPPSSKMSSVDLEEILVGMIDADLIKELEAGKLTTLIKIFKSDAPEDKNKQTFLCACAVHQVLNGPFGMGKVTEFVIRGVTMRGSISGQGKITGGMFFKFLQIVERIIVKTAPGSALGPALHPYGKTYPACKEEFEKTPREEKVMVAAKPPTALTVVKPLEE